ncbi:MAG: hypothetical protein ABII02_00510, partial [Candidatus Magasanikbacteria bacterium]
MPHVRERNSFLYEFANFVHSELSDTSVKQDERKFNWTQQVFASFSITIFICLVFFFFPHQAFGETNVPNVITYQGKLYDGGSAVTTSKDMKFLVYDAVSGGNLLYTASGTLISSLTISVTPTSGVFAVELGGTGTNSLSPTIFQNNQNLYLELVVSGTTLTPRKQLSATPFAMNSQYLMGVAATSTASTSEYIPISDGNGYFNFTRVGVNTTTPSYGLGVNGTAHVTGAATLGSTLGVTGASTFAGLLTAYNSTLGTVTVTSTLTAADLTAYLSTIGGLTV